MKIRVRNLWIGTCILLLGVLSWTAYSKNLFYGETGSVAPTQQTTDTDLTVDIQKLEQELQAELDPEFEDVGDTDIVTEDSQLEDILVSANLEKSSRAFFAQYRLDRDRVRGQQLDMLQGVIENEKISSATKTQAENQLIKINENLSKELEVESLLTAKNFGDAVVFIQEDTVTVIVEASELSDTDLARITDLVSRTTGKELEDIIVIPKG